MIGHPMLRLLLVCLCFSLIPFSGGADEIPLQPVEMYLKFSTLNNGGDSCTEALNYLSRSGFFQGADCSSMRGMSQTFRIRWKTVLNQNMQTWLENQKKEGVILWYEFHENDLHLQSIIPVETPTGLLSYYASLQPENPQAQDQDFVDSSVRQIRNLLIAYPPQKILIVAVIDSGVNFDSRLLNGLRWENLKDYPTNGVDDDHNGYKDDSLGWDFVKDSPVRSDEVSDTLGHGTIVANIVAATIGQDATKWLRIMPLRVANGSSGIGSVSPFALAEAIQYAANNGAQVINISLGSPQTYDIVRESIESALGKGVKIIVSAGNTSSNSVMFPANLPGVFAVGALDEQGNIWSGSAQGDAVDVYLRGTNMLHDLPVSFPSLSSNGTSYAAPMATGLSSMMLALAGNNPSECSTTRELIHTFRPVSHSSNEWLRVLTNKLEMEIRFHTDMEKAWLQKQPICGIQLTVASLLRRSK